MNGKKIHPSAVWRWARKGLRGIRLDVRRIGGRFVTSMEALERFTKALAELEVAETYASPLERQAAKCQQPVTKARTPAQRQKAIDRARKELAEVGV